MYLFLWMVLCTCCVLLFAKLSAECRFLVYFRLMVLDTILSCLFTRLRTIRAELLLILVRRVRTIEDSGPVSSLVLLMNEERVVVEIRVLTLSRLGILMGVYFPLSLLLMGVSDA